MAITTDIWVSCQTRSYCCVTAHFLTSSWTLETAVLETFEFKENHTGDSIAAELKRVVNSWGIADKIVCAITDKASNMVAAIDKTGWRHLPCFTHMLNLIVQYSIKGSDELSGIQHRCKESSDKLREVQQQLSLPEVKLIQKVLI